MDAQPPFKVSAIRFLNALPLTWMLLQKPAPAGLEVTESVPSGNADALARDRADAALLPSIEYPRIPGLVVLDGVAITSPGPVKSVLLVSRREPGALRDVAVTTHSRTSAALLRILLQRVYGNACPFLPFDDPDGVLERHDGMLIIGDPAMTGCFDGFQVFDLASMWSAFTGLPFVFAFWALQGDLAGSPLPGLLYRSAQDGIRRIPEIARSAARRTGLLEVEILGYLRENLSYRLGEAEKASLALFYRLAREEGLIEDDRPPAFVRVS
ncbi:MAG: menaquinone biosynthesis protein [Acidobacteria bacterium]|nr:menaquinone biosynthesis protein [Acidobacteriota bacterium]